MECHCCDECDHPVHQIVMRGLMPDTADGRPVNILLARKTYECDNCGAEWGAVAVRR